MKIKNFINAFSALGSEARALYLLLLAFACLVLPHFSHIPWWAIAVALSAYALKLRLMQRGATVPNRWLLSAFAALAGVGVLLEYKTFLGRDAGVTLLVMLGCMKLLELRARRDIFVVLFLGFFIALCQFLFSQSLGTAVLVFAGLNVLFLALVAQQVATDNAQTPPPLHRLVVLVLRMQMFALPLMLAAFILFPRIGPLWGNGDGAYASTGMSDTMTPGSISELVQSDAMAFRARFANAVPRPEQRYWRVMVLGRFDGRTWREIPAFSTPQETNNPPETWDYTVTLEAHGQRWLPLLDKPLAPPRLITNATNAQVFWSAYATASTDKLLRDRVQLQASSAPNVMLNLRENRFTLQRWLELPASFNPRTLAYAAELRQRAAQQQTSDIDLVQQVLSTFRNQNFVYTLVPPLLGLHSVDEFLFDTRTGFCEHYAGAFTVLMRALDIPARVVVGYQGGELNRLDNFYEIRQQDAHAWAEVWLPAQGWVRVDPTAAVAPERVQRGAARALPPAPGFTGLINRFMPTSVLADAWRQLRQYSDALNNAWNQWVIRYNNEGQRDFLQRLGFSEPNWRDMLLSLVASLAVISLGMAAWLFTKRAKPDPALKLYAQFEAALQKQGIQRDPHEGPQAFKRRVLQALAPAQAAQAEQIFNGWIKLRYRALADKAVSEKLWQRWRKAVKRYPK